MCYAKYRVTEYVMSIVNSRREGRKKRYRQKEEYEHCPHSSVQMWRFKGLWAEQMAFYASQNGIMWSHTTSQGVQSSTCAGIIVIVCAQQKSSVFHLKIYGKQSSCLLAPEMGQQPLQPLEVLARLGDYTGYRVCMDYNA